MAEPNFTNRTLYHGDNLDVLRGMNSETFQLIATDPPFKKERDFHATPDSLAAGAKFQDRWSWRDDIHDDWLDEIQRDHPEVWSVIKSAKEVYGDDMGAFLCFMGVRLLEMHRVLRRDGTLYLHCDFTASHYLKQLMDAIFGKRNFMNEIVWHYKSFHGNVKRYYARKHDIILVYTKSDKWVFNRLFDEDNEDTIDFQRWNEYLVDGYKILGNNMPMQDTRFLRFWRRWVKESGREPGPNDVVYEVKGQALDTVWDIKPVDPKDKKERVGYPTQKPLNLYERIVKASSNEGDWVLDPFCGCATTPIAAERMGRRWVGIDIWDNAYRTVLDRLEQEGLAVEYVDDEVQADPSKRLLSFANIYYTTTSPERTDRGEDAVIPFETPAGRGQRYPSPRSLHGRLLVDIGAFCQGCGRDYNFDSRVLEVDHIMPKSDGGTDHYDNLTLLCPPCNKEKRDRMTLSGLQDFNKREGYLTQENERNISRGRVTRQRGRRQNR